MLAAHRELKNVDVDSSELDEHLEQCPECRRVLANASFIGEQVRALPALEPPSEMQERLMRALASEHFKFMQRSPASTPAPPAFLQPYLQEQAHSSPSTDSLVAFSTASTGPLPVLKTPYKKRWRISGQFAVIGLAAVLFMALMIGGVTTLLFLARGYVVTNPASTSINQPAEVQQEAYTTYTPYQHVVSAVGDATSIYYSAYGNDLNGGWMLERMDRSTKISQPLLKTPSVTPLVILGSKNGWLVWLQFDAAGAGQGIELHGRQQTLLRGWSLHYLSLAAPQLAHIENPIPTTRKLASGTFDQEAVPGWIHTPVQGIWFVQDNLLVAYLGDNGAAHLVSYPLSTTGGVNATELARAGPGHVFTSPTANSDGSQIYWADEWNTNDGSLHSNIWTRQELNPDVLKHGNATQDPITITQPFLQNGTSFRPAVVDDELFLLDSSDQLGTTTTPGSTPTSLAVSTPTSSATPNTGASMTPWADSSVYTPPEDMSVRGNLVMLPLAGDPAAPPSLLSAPGNASDLQAGDNFVVWQSADGSFNMYDASAKGPVILNNDGMNGAQFMAVNGITAVWAFDNGTSASSGSFSPITLQAFNWPRK